MILIVIFKCLNSVTHGSLIEERCECVLKIRRGVQAMSADCSVVYLMNRFSAHDAAIIVSR